jgi:hypothetical protein
MKTIKYLITSIIILMQALVAFAQQPAQRTISYNLADMLTADSFSTTNRQLSKLPQNEKNGVMLSADQGEGIAWLNNVVFANGTIEFDVRGKNVEQQSFIGLAFHALADSKTFDVIYFRPFNFPATDSVKRSHSVQYASHPQFTWPVLREKFNGRYESAIQPLPNPDKWFHVRMEVNYPEVTVFVNNNPKPSLSVKQLSDRKTGLLGLWVGNNADGAFANLKVTYID